VDSDNDLETNLTPRTEAKYNKIDEEFQIMMQHRNHVNGSRNLPSGFSSMPVSVPVNASDSYGGSDNSSHDQGQMPISPGHLSASSPRPHSGNGMMDVQHQNGYHHSSVGSPLPPSHTPSPGLTNGSPSASSVKSKDLRATNLKVVIPSTPSGGPGGPGGLLGISRNHEEEGRLGFHSFGNNVAAAAAASAVAPSVTSSSQNFTDLSLSHLANSWNHQEPPQAINTSAVPPPSITLTAAASSVGMSHTIPHVNITNTSTPPPSVSPAENHVRVKAEPQSPRDLHAPPGHQFQHHHTAQLQRPHSASSAMSPQHHGSQGM